MSKKTKWIVFGSIALVVVLIALKYMGVYGKVEGTKVTAEAVKKRTITEIVSASGKIYPEIEVKVSPDISGEITELTVQEGDTVKKGQVVARIFADIYSITANQAAAGVAQTQAQVRVPVTAAVGWANPGQGCTGSKCHAWCGGVCVVLHVVPGTQWATFFTALATQMTREHMNR